MRRQKSGKRNHGEGNQVQFRYNPFERWRDGRVAEGGGLLNRYRVKSSIGGSNPPLSASNSSISLNSADRQKQIADTFRGLGIHGRLQGKFCTRVMWLPALTSSVISN